MSLQPPPGQGPIDPRGAFSPPPPPGQGGPGQPGGAGGWSPPSGLPPGLPPGFMPPPFPPPMMPPPWYPPPPKQRGFARAIFTTLATTIFGISIALNLYLLAFGALMSARSSRSNLVVEGDPKQKVVVVPVETSMMLAAQAEQFDKMLTLAEKDADVKAIVIKIDTPGGSVTAADEMYNRVQVFRSRKPGVPIVVTMGGSATSGGYYLACAGDYIFAQPTTITGNIGVILPHYNLSKLADKWGIEDDSIHSTGADYKEAGSLMKPMSSEERAYLLGLIDSAFKRFKTVVATGRSGRLTQSIDQIANGKAYTADEAKALGLIDHASGYPADAYAYAATKAGLKNMTVVRYELQTSFLDMFSSSSKLLPAKASSSVQINGVNVDASRLDELLTPRLLYMWRE